MRRVTAQLVDTYSAPDRSEQVALTQKQKQVQSAFDALGVGIKKKVILDEKAEAAAAKAAAKEAEKQREFETKLAADAAKAKLKLAGSDIGQTQFRFHDRDGLTSNEYVQNAKAAIEGIEDKNTRTEMIQELDQMLDSTLATHAQTVKREDNITNFGAVVADTLQVEYDASDVNRLVDDHKVVLGDDTLPQMADIALSLEEIPAIDALLARDDLHPQTIAELNNGKSRILAAQARENKASKEVMHREIKLADDLDSRRDKFEAKLKVLEQYDDLLTDNQKGTLQADLLTLEQEVKTEEAVKLALGDRNTRELADPANWPEGFKALPLADIKRIQDREFNKALADGDKARIAHLTRDPTDLPRAAKSYFGSFMSDISAVDVEELSDDILARWDQAKALESELGPSKMQVLLGAGDYAKYQVLSGIGSQEGLKTAIRRYQEYETLTAKGVPSAPTDFTKAKKGVVDDVIDVIEDAGWFSFDYDTNRTSVESALAPYFKVWSAMGLDESQMSERAKKTIGNSSWMGMVSGRTAKEHFEALSRDNDGPIYDETPEELFQKGIELSIEEFRKNQPGLPEKINVRPLATDPTMMFFIAEDGTPIENGIVSLERMSQRVIDNVMTIKDRLLAEADKRESMAESLKREQESYGF